MNTIIKLNNASKVEDETELTEGEFALLDLSTLRKKVRVRVQRSDGTLEIQHVEKKLHLTLHIDFAFSTKADYQEHINIAEEALRNARWLLDRDRLKDPVYGDVDNGRITVFIADTCIGAEALAALNKAVAILVDRANALLKVVAGGIKTVQPEDQDWW